MAAMMGSLTLTPAEDGDLVKKLKEWDKNGDGQFSEKEVMKVAQDMLLLQTKHRYEKRSARRWIMVSMAVCFFLMLSLAGGIGTTILAIEVSRQEEVSQKTGVLTTKGKNDDPIKPVATANMKQAKVNIATLKDASQEELDDVETVTFFHDGGYHKMRASQIHRYDGRVEVWGCPFGVLVVEDTGEVHYLPNGLPDITFDNCWGPDSTGSAPETCGIAVDNLPPSDLEVSAELTESSDRRLTNQEDGDTLSGVNQSKARRLSGRRRSGGGWSSGGSRRRSGSVSSSRRRSSGGSTTYIYVNGQRRYHHNHYDDEEGGGGGSTIAIVILVICGVIVVGVLVMCLVAKIGASDDKKDYVPGDSGMDSGLPMTPLEVDEKGAREIRGAPNFKLLKGKFPQIGQGVVVTKDLEVLKYQCQDAGLTWPTDRKGTERAMMLGEKGAIRKIDFTDNTVQLPRADDPSDSTWVPILALAGWGDVPEATIEAEAIEGPEGNAQSSESNQKSDL
mmetsp:Transcript_120701/g.225547  ORF Transcript_120701/g.225547 Transcript_120701/m.225547 type:complete len:504 (-) Transcript_120701:40-1551(-)